MSGPPDPEPLPEPVTGTARLVAPRPGAILEGATVRFTWSGPSHVEAYALGVARTWRSLTVAPWGDVRYAVAGTATELTLDDLPADGSLLHVRLWYRIAGVWYARDTEHRAAGFVPRITHVLTEPERVRLFWDAQPGVDQVFVGVGSTPESLALHPWGDLLGRSVAGTEASLDVPRAEAGERFFVRLWARSGTRWLAPVDVAYPAPGEPVEVGSSRSWREAVEHARGGTLLVTRPTRVEGALWIPAETRVRVLAGGALEVPAGSTLALAGALEADATEVFTGAGSVAFEGEATPEVLLEWWGARGDGLHDDAPAFQRALESGRPIRLLDRTYRIHARQRDPANPRVWDHVQIADRPVAIRGTSRRRDEPVEWIGPAGVAVEGDTLTKTEPSGWNRAGATSAQAFVWGEGHVELRATETTTARGLGLAYGRRRSLFVPERNDRDLDVYVWLRPDGTASCYSQATDLTAGAAVRFVPGDRFRVSVERVDGRDVMRCRHNGRLLATSPLQPRFPLRATAVFHDRGATIAGVTIAGTFTSVLVASAVKLPEALQPFEIASLPVLRIDRAPRVRLEGFVIDGNVDHPYWGGGRAGWWDQFSNLEIYGSRDVELKGIVTTGFAGSHALAYQGGTPHPVISRRYKTGPVYLYDSDDVRIHASSLLGPTATEGWCAAEVRNIHIEGFRSDVRGNFPGDPDYAFRRDQLPATPFNLDGPNSHGYTIVNSALRGHAGSALNVGGTGRVFIAKNVIDGIATTPGFGGGIGMDVEATSFWYTGRPWAPRAVWHWNEGWPVLPTDPANLCRYELAGIAAGAHTGSTGATEPVWPVTGDCERHLGATVQDGALTWRVTGTKVVHPDTTGVTIAGNDLRHSYQASIGIGGETNDPEHVYFHDVRIEQNAIADAPWGILILGADDVVVQRNQLSEISMKDAQRTEGSLGTPVTSAAIRLDLVSRAAIAGNTIDGRFEQEVALAGGSERRTMQLGLYLAWVRDTTVSGNRVLGARHRNVLLSTRYPTSQGSVRRIGDGIVLRDNGFENAAPYAPAAAVELGSLAFPACVTVAANVMTSTAGSTVNGIGYREGVFTCGR